MKKLFNIQELLHGKSKHHGTKPMHPSSSRAFQRHQEHDLKHPGLTDLITTKQNKLPCFIDRWCSQLVNNPTTYNLWAFWPPCAFTSIFSFVQYCKFCDSIHMPWARPQRVTKMIKTCTIFFFMMVMNLWYKTGSVLCDLFDTIKTLK